MSAAWPGRRGHPLMFLAALLLAWVGVRLASWEPPFSLGGPIAGLEKRALGSLAGWGGAGGGASSPAERSRRQQDRAPDAAEGRSRQTAPDLPGLVPAPLEPLTPAALDPGQARLPPSPAAAATDRGLPEGRSLARMAVGHALLAMMGLSQMQVPPALAALLELRRRPADGAGAARLAQGGEAAPGAPAPAAGVPARFSEAARRWAGDAWLLVREGGPRAPVAGQPSYGRSQAGAVLRYRLAPSSGHAPQAYVRASSALSAPRDAELAAGLSARPVAQVPLRVAAEVRVADIEGRAEVRPAAYAVTEFPPLALPYGTRAEAYAQAGYVGGDFATPFVDGQVRLTRDLARLGERAGLSAGAGAWGGAQEGAARLDIGPSAAVSFSLGQVYSRLSVDYRLRVAGDAEPESGPALTLSAGF